jgi:uncharacterized SAM-binding protein YcdF (DUF218 family)
MRSIIEILSVPSGFALLSLFVGTLLLFNDGLRKTGRVLVVLAIFILIPMSTGTVATILLSPLEYQFPIVDDIKYDESIHNIVVLTGAAEDDSQWPLSSRLNSSSTYRLLEAYRLFEACLDCQVYFSGDGVAARLMKQLLVAMGVPEDHVFVDGESPHTYDSAVNIKKNIRAEKFYLVTSAGHMPRAMGVFKKQGMDPVAAPTDFLQPKNFRKASLSLSPLHLYWSDLAIREYEALIWYHLADKI